MFRKAAILIAIFLWTATAMAEAQAPFRIAFPSFPPFHWVKEDGTLAGFFHDIVQEALEKRMGMTVVWTAYPWTRCQESVKAGADDGIITVPTAERAAYTVTHRDPFYLKPLNLFTYRGHPRWQEIRKVQKIVDLKKGGFSIITYSGNGWHKTTVEPLGIKTYETAYLENVWKMLAERRGDTVIEWPAGAWPDIRRAGVADRVVDTSVTLASMPFHLLIRKDHPRADLLVRFDETIRKMKADGTMKTILSKYP